MRIFRLAAIYYAHVLAQAPVPIDKAVQHGHGRSHHSASRCHVLEDFYW